jgi:predicted membrane metal-binding protein
MIGSSEPARLLDLRLLLRLKDRAVRARNRNCVLAQDCAGQSENKRNRTPAAELDFGSEANHAISDYQTLFAAVPTVKQNQPQLSMLSASNDRLNEMISSRFNASTIHRIKLRQWCEWSSGIGDIEGKVARVATSERG